MFGTGQWLGEQDIVNMPRGQENVQLVKKRGNVVLVDVCVSVCLSVCVLLVCVRVCKAC